MTSQSRTHSEVEMIVSLSLFLMLLQYSKAFFMTGQACGCPPINPMCPPQPKCPMGGVVTHHAQPIPVPDELEMRAAAFGVPIGQRQHSPSNLEQFEKLVDRQEAVNAAAIKQRRTKSENTEFAVHLRNKPEVRRAPAIHTGKSEEAESATAAEKSGVDENPTTTSLPEATSKCNSLPLRKLMLENMSLSSSESKRKINAAAEAKFGGNVDVICSRGHFSYVFSSNLYCEATKDLVTCIAFRQAASV